MIITKTDSLFSKAGFSSGVLDDGLWGEVRVDEDGEGGWRALWSIWPASIIRLT